MQATRKKCELLLFPLHCVSYQYMMMLQLVRATVVTLWHGLSVKLKKLPADPDLHIIT